MAISPIYLRLASTVCSLGVLAGNYQWLATLPTNALVPLLLSIGTLIALSFIQDVEKDELRHYPATEWKFPPALGVREAFPKFDAEDAAKSFEKICECLIEECTRELPETHELPSMEKKWIVDMLEYNVKGGKMNRGLMVLETGAVILRSQGQEPTEDEPQISN